VYGVPDVISVPWLSSNVRVQRLRVLLARIVGVVAADGATGVDLQPGDAMLYFVATRKLR
jgi:hypothetical protein